MCQYDVYGVGNALVDVVVEVDDAFFAQHDIPKGVTSLIDEPRLHDLMKRLEGKAFTLAAGGSAANAIIGLTQLGGKGAYSFITARDKFGKKFIADMRRQGVALSTRYEDCPKGRSGLCLVMVSPDAERTMSTFLGVSATLSTQQVSEEFVRQSHYVYLEGYPVASPQGFEALKQTKQLARRHGVYTAFTLSDSNMVKFFFRELSEVIGDGVDLLFCNEQEALDYTRQSSLPQACRQLQQAARHIVVTRSAKGSMIYDGQQWLDIPPHPAVQVIDTVGAGDAFAGGFLYGLTRGYSYPQSGQIASIIASHVIAQVGPRLTPPHTQRFLQELQLQLGETIFGN